MFENDFLNRILLTLIIIASAAALYLLSNRFLLRRARSQATELIPALKNCPVLLYFSSPACAPCQTVQRPAIQRLSELTGERLNIVEIDTTEKPELASQWGVLSVPTTYLIDAQGQPRYVNHGVMPLEKLLQQLSTL